MLLRATVVPSPSPPGGPIRTLAVSLIGAAALAAAAGLVFMRQQKACPDASLRPTQTPAGETVPVDISLERLRELGY